MKKTVREQLSESEFEKFGTLFRCKDEDTLSFKLKSILEKTLSEKELAQNISAEVNIVFIDHLKAVKFFLCFYNSHEIEEVDIAKEINQKRGRLENKFDNKVKYFKEIQKRCDKYKRQKNELNHSIKSTRKKRKEYPLHPPADFLSKKDMDALEKFLHWDVFLSSLDDQDASHGHSYLYIESAGNIGSGGVHVEAQEHNRELTMRLMPILLNTQLSARKKAIVIWAHQYFVSKLYDALGDNHMQNYFIPALSSLIKDINKLTPNKT